MNNFAIWITTVKRTWNADPIRSQADVHTFYDNTKNLSTIFLPLVDEQGEENAWPNVHTFDVSTNYRECYTR